MWQKLLDNFYEVLEDFLSRNICKVFQNGLLEEFQKDCSKTRKNSGRIQKKVPLRILDGFLEKIPKAVSETIAEEVPEGISDGVLEQSRKKFLKDSRKNFLKESQKKIPKPIPVELPRGFLVEVFGGIPQRIHERSS